MNIKVFTDGSCINNGNINAKAGYGIYFPNNEIENISKPFVIRPITNQRAELYAIYQALVNIVENIKFTNITIYTDSLYSIKCLTQWVKAWEKNNWKTTNNKPVKNLDIIKPINSILKEHGKNVTLIHVRSHTGLDTFESKCNDYVDQLAYNGYIKN